MFLGTNYWSSNKIEFLNREFYERSKAEVSITRIAKLLMAMEEGSLEKYQGVNFDDFLKTYLPIDRPDNPFEIEETINVDIAEDSNVEEPLTVR